MLLEPPQSMCYFAFPCCEMGAASVAECRAVGSHKGRMPAVCRYLRIMQLEDSSKKTLQLYIYFRQK